MKIRYIGQTLSKHQRCLETSRHSLNRRPIKGENMKLRFSFSFILSFFLLTSMASSAVTEGVGLYIGSFDPPTIGHREIVLTSALKANLKNVYVSVNRGGKNSSKDYRWGLGERLSMVRSMFRDVSIRVVVLAEPLEDRVALANQLIRLHNKTVRGIFGADTLAKNYNIFKQVPDFEYIAVNRPGYDLPKLPTGTVIHSLESPGDISSTNVRKKLADGIRGISELYPSVEALIYKNNPLQSPTKGGDSAFNLIFVDFQNKMQKLLPKLGVMNLPPPEYNPQQTREGQKEKIIRAVMSLTDGSNEWQVLPLGQQTVETYHRSFPIQDQRKAGFFLGSFDPISIGQIAAINKAIAIMGLEVIYFSPLAESRKPIKYPILDRIAAIEIIKDKVAAEVRILPSSSLIEAVEVVDRLNDRHGGNVLAVFGDTVFDANYQRMSHIKNLDFGVFTFGGRSSPDFPAGVSVIVTNPSIKGAHRDVTQLLVNRSEKRRLVAQ